MIRTKQASIINYLHELFIYKKTENHTCFDYDDLCYETRVLLID